MQSKISPLAAIAAAAFIAAPVLAADAHLVPVPTDVVTTESTPKDEVAAEAAAPEIPALPSKLPWAELNGFPKPPIPGAPKEEEEEEDSEASGTEETTTAMTWSTWCPEPTVFTWGAATISVSTAAWVTLTECPLSSTSSSTATVAPIVPHPHPHPHPGPEGPEGPEEHGEGHGESPEIKSVAPVKPPAHSAAPVAPVKPPVVVSILGVTFTGLG